ncbi:unnamed protein product [Dovyalis caffra]|uniref:Uncharacterized protein n=1 Tax=Dovyalis caffra TaxID=77055 RepID=A0AAV1RX67_9ROSI|nr:unnamed protein product [Dovyalis caffra]
MIVLATNDVRKMAKPINGCKVADLDAGGLRTGGESSPKPEAGFVDEFITDGVVLQKSEFPGDVVAGFADEVAGAGTDGVPDEDADDG